MGKSGQFHGRDSSGVAQRATPVNDTPTLADLHGSRYRTDWLHRRLSRSPVRTKRSRCRWRPEKRAAVRKCRTARDYFISGSTRQPGQRLAVAQTCQAAGCDATVLWAVTVSALHGVQRRKIRQPSPICTAATFRKLLSAFSEAFAWRKVLARHRRPIARTGLRVAGSAVHARRDRDGCLRRQALAFWRVCVRQVFVFIVFLAGGLAFWRVCPLGGGNHARLGMAAAYERLAPWILQFAIG